MAEITSFIGRTVFGNRIKEIQKRLNYAGIKTEAHDFAGIYLTAGVLFSLACSFLIFFWLNNIYYAGIALVLSAFVFYVTITAVISLLADQRGRYIESVLPDALQLMAANLRSGLATDEALVLSARPEFGFLAEKIKTAGDRIATGEKFVDAFREISKDIDSDILRHTVDLIIEGEASGGRLSSILDGTAIDIRDTKTIQSEVQSVIMVYATFIFIAVALIAPVLYAVSTQLAGILSKLSQAASVQFLTKNAPTLQLAPAQISQDFLMVFSYVNLAILSIFGSLMIALINRGNEKYGLKYIPFILGLSLALFYIGRVIMQAFFGGIRVL